VVIKFGIIGYRNHSLRLIKIIEKNRNCKIDFIYHPTKKITDIRGTNDLSDLFECDAIVISSPNETHYNYIVELENFKGYIFCEKPPVISKIQLKYLEKLPQRKKEKIFFNFNYRFSKLNQNLIKQLKSKKIGKIIQIYFITGHGLAFKNNYLDSWRSDGKRNMHNILDTVAIHFLDLVSFDIGIIDEIEYFPNNYSKNGSSYDTSNLLLKFKKGPLVSIFNSYATSHLNEIMIIGTNGYFSSRDDEIIIRYPRDTFNNEGLFSPPPIKTRKKYNAFDDHNFSLMESVNYFVKCIKTKKKIPLKLFESSIATNKVIINLKNEFSKK